MLYEVITPIIDDQSAFQAAGLPATLATRLDHSDLNTVAPFDEISPTAEHVARWFWESLAPSVTAGALESVTVWEAPGCSVTYRP